MTTGSNYSPDYKSEKPLHRFPVGPDGLTDGMRAHLQSEGERARLRDAVVEACSAYCASALEMEENGKPEGMTYNDWHVQHSAKQDAVIDAYKALVEFEQKQK